MQLHAGEHVPLAGNDKLTHRVHGGLGACGAVFRQGADVHKALSQTGVVGRAAHGGDKLVGAVVHGGLNGLLIVDVPVPDGGSQVSIGGVCGHVRVVTAAVYPGVGGRQLGLGGVAVLGDDAAVVGVDQLLGEGILVLLVRPGAQLLDIDGGLGVDRQHAHGEAVDAGAGLSVLGAVGGDVADAVIAFLQALQAGGHASQVAGLVNAAEVVVEVGFVALIAGGVREDHLGILFRLIGQGVDVAEGDAEDNIAAFAHQGVHCGGHGLIVLSHLIHDHQLAVYIQAQVLHGSGDAVVVGVGVAGGVVLAVDIDGAHLEVGVGAVRLTALLPGRAGAVRGVALPVVTSVVAAAGGQGESHHGGHHKGQKSFLHVFVSSLEFYPFDPSIITDRPYPTGL